MRILVLNLTVRETNAGHQFFGHVDDRSNLNLHIFALLMKLHLPALHLVSIASEEQAGDVVGVGELPRVVRLMLLDHLL